ncbi:hypothetical protein BN946_scf184816.g5 [Trametes cinnabarina]|uniref:MULE transposase domain-containing protein n=1 Tax=Pycnoporus cinnabarinus TaxID=5643 RepID=A0A060SIR1_PYCCI|nr:hypothetical protein BN946_scf184816.g5 [Trametes cinnabarina]
MPQNKKCEQCHAHKALTKFKPRKFDTSRGKKGEPLGICATCAEKKAARKRKARALEVDSEAATEDAHNRHAYTDLGEKQLADLLDLLTELTEPLHVQARVDVSQIAAQNQDQRKHKEKIPRGIKPRDSRRGERFACGGWLHLVLSDKTDIIELRLSHGQAHLPYVDILLPEEWRAYIAANARDHMAGQIWRHIVRVEDERRRETSKSPIPFRAKAVYYHWLLACRKDWKLHPNPVVSAQRFLEQHGDQYHLKLINLEGEPGTEAVAFYVEDFVQGWAAHTQELAMDSTWNTNGGNFELFATIADANGSGVPLAFMFIRTSDGATMGAKQRMLERFLTALRDLGIQPEFTLTDKDWSEINAMRAVWPKAKHQLCFWHALHALKQRLCKNKDTPAPYDAVAAKEEFPFIDVEFVPKAQQENPLSPQEG